ncbi:ATP-binding response regulator [Phormidium sp. CCY1219]|uniref:ATP-binding response regulator n=1 Tax=Phormidium sp. CCY1219 TaxID=2886104 RepID=UPI002D1E8F34|nr:response regulator [Phormidium sp. CCY1219]MEB3831084.1 response regulator [Phormidium sp. CCY1219]
MVLRILLVDDNPDDRFLIVRELKREFKAVQFEEILDLAHLEPAIDAGQFDLVVSDYQLRWSTGIDVLQAVKARYPKMPVVMFTNSGNEEIAVRAMKEGLDDYVVKSPKHYSRLSAAVRSAWERTQAEQRAATLQTELESLLNRLNVGVFRLTRAGKLVQGNKAFLNLLGVEDLSAAQELLSQQWSSAIGSFLEEIESHERDNLLQTEVEICRGDGNSLWVELTKTKAVRNGKVFVDGLMDDISDRKQVEQERLEVLQREQAAREAAENANRMKDEFLAVLSHELRSPLNAILGWATMMRARKLSDAKRAAALESIERNAKLQTQLVEDLLDTSRLLQGRMRLSVGEMSLIPTIEAAIETVRLAAQAKDIELRVELDPEEAWVMGDPNRLQQVFWNLVSNAVKFTDPGGWVEVRLDRLESEARIQVRDSGQGIDPEFVPFVFDRFRQANASTTRSFGGLGLGLAIARQLVEMHGGRISVASDGEGAGTTFTVWLPLHQGSSDPEEASASGGEGEDADKFPLVNLRVLVVDDEIDARDLLALLLEEYGAQVRAVGSVAEAKAELERFDPMVLVCDIGMPLENGYDLIRFVREEGNPIPAIALTAYARFEDVSEALAAGFQVHLPKPLDAARLVEAIASLANVPQTDPP